ncbi:hypothetical protein [Singulisphaera acidiphila]|uniref:Lipoprotein n=1 Tax=Singulisphaera acidiphila (strain ATCC BAA-1392 / DSM 18658 / VKM B-2454 / MOB10) TaxID=886293 RepID=L0DE95_SINAD|nr:hypothetical protein [Singulisphaera acidiphila]AGA27180.1 hypothetical protein Sinac_2891 [Singulisphaera acidiphila DSM 18658]
MKHAWIAVLVPALVALAGCNQDIPQGQGVITTLPRKPLAYGEADITFNRSVPRMSTPLHQGEAKDVSTAIERGRSFEGDVTFQFTDNPPGVTLDSVLPVIKNGDTLAKFTLEPQSDASPGDFTIKVTGHGSKGADAAVPLKASVPKK